MLLYYVCDYEYESVYTDNIRGWERTILCMCACLSKKKKRNLLACVNRKADSHTNTPETGSHRTFGGVTGASFELLAAVSPLK